MVRRRLLLVTALLVGIFAAGMGVQSEVARMEKDELKARLSSSGIVVIDVRREQDWDESSRKIAGALRENPGASQEWAGKYPKGKTLVLYCA